ncbi:hypothetical protein [Solilutibacter silvestris]|uniref:hypothetical protein n=1 Tax=Solilutibacter silvestris TaxID=1645665 RepID=UPI003D33035F
MSLIEVVGGAFLVLVFGVAGIGWLSNSQDEKKEDTSNHIENSKSDPVVPKFKYGVGEVHTISGKAFGCRDKEVLKRIRTFAAQEDKEAFGNTLVGGIATGECALYDKYDQVFSSDQEDSEFGEIVLVRRRGQASQFWIPMSAIDDSIAVPSGNKDMNIEAASAKPLDAAVPVDKIEDSPRTTQSEETKTRDSNIDQSVK